MSQVTLEDIAQQIVNLATDVRAQGERLSHVEAKLDKLDKLDQDVQRFNDRLETYQKASDRVANLAFTVVTASAAVVVLAPVVKVATDIAINFASKVIQ